MNIDERLATLEAKVDEIAKSFTAFNIDKQQLVKGMNIQPGTATKVYYNASGLVVSGEQLSTADIPELPMEKIDGLSESITSKINRTEFERLERKVAEVHHHGDTVATGTKVNVDANGYVNDVMQLTAEDVPMLPIAKIDGLQAAIDELRSTSNVQESNDLPITRAGTGTKLTFDEYGRVIDVEPLSMDDIPRELLIQLEQLKSEVASKAPADLLASVEAKLNQKIDQPTSAISGSYSKVVVDNNGLVIGGSQLHRDDLPSLAIDDINGLRDALNRKVDENALAAVEANVANVQPNYVGSNVDLERVHSLELRVTSLEEIFNKIINAIPSDRILETTEHLSADISTLSGRVATIESYLHLVE